MSDIHSKDPGSFPNLNLAAGEVILKDYRIVRRLGSGGSGQVYLVESLASEMQYAMKIPRRFPLWDQKLSRLFFREIRTWIDLPSHPNLTECYFFRTLAGQPAIFSEYVDGGSLRDWIVQGKPATVPPVIDMAIQLAAGLIAAHESGVIHQDIKPANVLITRQGTAKITDFGLARARELAGDNMNRKTILPNGANPSVSTGIFTPAFCSPEQSRGERLDHRTDIWSWGVSVLTMFVGRPTWYLGNLAPVILEQYRKEPASDTSLKMPDILVEILQKCFQENPEDRWSSLHPVIDGLIELYERITDQKYPGDPVIYSRQYRSNQIPDLPEGEPRQKTSEQWLERAYELAGMDSSFSQWSVPPKIGSRSARALRDMEILEEATGIMQQGMARFPAPVIPDYCKLLLSKARIQMTLEDIPGMMATYDEILTVLKNRLEEDRAYKVLFSETLRLKASHSLFHISQDEAVSLIDQAIQCLRDCLEEKASSRLTVQLAAAYGSKVKIYGSYGHIREAVDSADTTITFCRRSMELYDAQALKEILQTALSNKACGLHQLGKHDQALELFNLCISDSREKYKTDPSNMHAFDLAMSCINKANVLQVTGDHEITEACFSEAVELLADIVKTDPSKSDILAIAYMGMGTSCDMQQRLAEAGVYYDKSIAIREKLVFRDGRWDQAFDLAGTYINKGILFAGLRDYPTALIHTEKAVKLFRKVVSDARNIEARFHLANALRNVGRIHYEAGDYKAALVPVEESIQLAEPLMDRADHAAFLPELLICKTLKLEIFGAMKRTGDARRLFDEIKPQLEAEYARTGRPDLKASIESLADLYG